MQRSIWKEERSTPFQSSPSLIPHLGFSWKPEAGIYPVHHKTHTHRGSNQSDGHAFGLWEETGEPHRHGENVQKELSWAELWLVKGLAQGHTVVTTIAVEEATTASPGIQSQRPSSKERLYFPLKYPSFVLIEAIVLILHTLDSVLIITHTHTQTQTHPHLLNSHSNKIKLARRNPTFVLSDTGMKWESINTCSPIGLAGWLPAEAALKRLAAAIMQVELQRRWGWGGDDSALITGSEQGVIRFRRAGKEGKRDGVCGGEVEWRREQH